MVNPPDAKRPSTSAKSASINANGVKRPKRPKRLPRLILMGDDERLPDPATVARTLPAGSAVIVRHRHPRGRYLMARALHPVCAAGALHLIIAGDVRLALKVGASGIHLAEHQVRRSAMTIHRAHEHRMLVTAAVHSRKALRHAIKAGVDAVLVSPVFASASHRGRPGLGVIRFAALIRSCTVPVYALGGMDEAGLRRLRPLYTAGNRAGTITGIAGISALARLARDPAAAGFLRLLA